MKIYVDKNELVTIEHGGKFAIVDVLMDFPKGDLEYAWVAPTPYVPSDIEGDVLVYASVSEEPKTLPVKYHDTVVGYAKQGIGFDQFIITITDERAIEFLSLNDPAGISVSL